MLLLLKDEGQKFKIVTFPCLLDDGGDPRHFGKNRVGRTFGTPRGEGKRHQNVDGEDTAEYGSCAHSESRYLMLFQLIGF